ncbi:hypothetical protein, partial [Pseudomonas sp. MD330_10]|uniref:hypothetical protein n=1 Tax=Pseudomonas sp. MD330_10 TaxID=3241254 RepID=UPI0036D30DF3
QRELGGGLPPIGYIFLRTTALAPSYIAQVFGIEGGNAAGASGFLGFGGGYGGVFGSSTLSGLFNRENQCDASDSKAF